MAPNLARAINRGMRCIEANQLVIGADDLSGYEREGLEMLTYMSWQRVEVFPAEIRDILPQLEARGLVELRALVQGAPRTLVRLTIAKQRSEA